MLNGFKTFFLLLILAAATLSCGVKTTNTDITDDLLQYKETELSTFSISGTAACSWCKSSDVTAMQVEVVPADDPTVSLAMNVFDGLGSFYFSDLRYKKGVKITLYGKVYFGTGNTGAEASTDITVPQKDGDTVSCVMNFPSR
jgi:hypothetical protein